MENIEKAELKGKKSQNKTTLWLRKQLSIKWWQGSIIKKFLLTVIHCHPGPHLSTSHIFIQRQQQCVFQETTECERDRRGSHGKNNMGLCIKTKMIKNGWIRECVACVYVWVWKNYCAWAYPSVYWAILSARTAVFDETVAGLTCQGAWGKNLHHTTPHHTYHHLCLVYPDSLKFPFNTVHTAQRAALLWANTGSRPLNCRPHLLFFQRFKQVWCCAYWCLFLWLENIWASQTFIGQTKNGDLILLCQSKKSDNRKIHFTKVTMS